MDLYGPGMARNRKRQRPEWIDPSILYTRQQIGERVGLSDDVLSYWIKRRLLVPEPQEGSGKGVHHRFHYSQVNIAVLLKAVRDHFGANIRTLKSLADTMQSAIRLFRRTKAPPDTWLGASWLADKLGRFRKGEEVEVVLFVPEAGGFRDDPFRTERRAAASEAEIVADSLKIWDGNPSDMINLAEMLGPGKSGDYEIASLCLGVPINPRYAGDDYWLLSNKDGKWVIRRDTDEANSSRADVGPAMFLPAYRMVRKAWSIPHNLRSLDQCARLRAALKDAGVEADVSPGEDYPDVRVTSDDDTAKAQDILNNFYKPDWMKERDGDDFSAYRSPSDYADIYWSPESNAEEIARIKDELVELDRSEQAELDKR